MVALVTVYTPKGLSSTPKYVELKFPFLKKDVGGNFKPSPSATVALVTLSFLNMLRCLKLTSY